MSPSLQAPAEVAPGEIITFYSYKGGTGRSMALANVGCLLAERTSPTGRGVLMIDWDLEAPGLHRYFQHLYAGGDGRGIDEPPGLVELFSDIAREVPTNGYENEDEAAEHALALAEKFPARRYALPLQMPGLFLLKAGRFDDEYSKHVNTFDWEGLYRRSPSIFRALAESWAEEFDYVLIDSRTGLTDTSGICTMLMPEKLVVVFTPNRQSFTGVANLVRKATRYRKESEDLRPLIVFPLPSRIEASLVELRKLWRFGDTKQKVDGYQPLFQDLFKEVYNLTPTQADLTEYFEEVQIQQTPDYAYGEEIAVRVERHSDRFSLTRSYQTFTDRLVLTEGPWARTPEERAEPSRAADAKRAELLAAADRFYIALSPEELMYALRVLARLVNVSPPGGSGRGATPERINPDEIEPASKEAAGLLIAAGLVVVSHEGEGTVADTVPGKVESGGTATALDESEKRGAFLEVADESLVKEWQPLREWIDENREFLHWRQKLKTYLTDWEQGGRSPGDLLSGSTLQAAHDYLRKRPDELNEAEASYIKESIRLLRLRRRVRIVLAVVALLVLLGFLLLVRSYLRIKTTPVTGNANATPVFGGGGDFKGGGSDSSFNTNAGGNVNGNVRANANAGSTGAAGPATNANR